MSIDDNIWLTCKTRMHAEKRYKKYSFFAHLIFSYYALSLIVTSLFSKHLSENIEYFYEINIALSISLFAASLVIYGFGYEQLSSKHRECYLLLHTLLNDDQSNKSKKDEYHKILNGFPNQETKDYEDLIVERVWLRGEELNNSRGSIEITKLMVFWYFTRHAFFYAFILICFLLPPISL